MFVLDLLVYCKASTSLDLVGCERQPSLYFVLYHYYGLLFSCSGMSSLFLCFDVVFVSYVVFALCGRAAGWRAGWRAGTAGVRAGGGVVFWAAPLSRRSVVRLASAF